MTNVEGMIVGTYKTRAAAELDAARMSQDAPDAPPMVLYVNDDASWTLVDVTPDSYYV